MQTNSNFQHFKAQHLNCFFSQVREVTHDLRQSKSNLLFNKRPNCIFRYKSDQLLIITQGGTKYNLPLDQQVTKVLPLAEGILIQYIPKHQYKLNQILYLQKNKNVMDIEDASNINQQPKFCYATLTRHPLNPLKTLSQLRQQDIIPWMKQNQKITCASNEIPLIITYNYSLHRNAFHLLLGNVPEVKNQFDFAYIPTNSYSLKKLLEVPHSQIITQTIFQENYYAQQIYNIKLLKSSPLKPGIVTLYGQTSKEIKIYQISLYTTFQPTKLIATIKSSPSIETLYLYPIHSMFFPQPFNKSRNDYQSDVIINTINQLPQCMALSERNSITYYIGGQRITCKTILKEDQSKIHQKYLIKDSFDALIMKSLQYCLENESLFLKILTKYCLNIQFNRNIGEILQEFLPSILQTIHQVYEQLKLYQTMRNQRQRVGKIICSWIKTYKIHQYIDYYLREGLYNPLQNQSISKSIDFMPKQQPFNLFLSLCKLLSLSSQNIFKKNQFNVIFKRTEYIISFFQLLSQGQIRISPQYMIKNLQISNKRQSYIRNNQYPLFSQKVFHLDYFSQIYFKNGQKQKKINQQLKINKIEKAFLYLVKNSKSRQQILSYPISIRVVFSWILKQMRVKLRNQLYQLIPQLGFDLIHRQDIFKNIKLYRKSQRLPPFHLKDPLFDQHIKTLVHTSTSHQYFLTSNAAEMNKVNNDLAFEQVYRLLSSTSQIRIKVKDIQSIPQDQWQVQSQQILQKFANRKLAVLIGQSAFTLGTSRSFITDIIKIEKINLSGVMPNDLKITMDLKDDKQNLIYWPQFHSGMAAGLKLSRHVIPLSQDHLKTWIFYQKPDTPKRDHSGFLLSLGLLGYLRCFSPTDIYQYLKPNNQFTSLAILLGVSASNISKSDEALSKTLVLHIPVLLPPSIDVQIPINVQTSALIGIGLLHKGTCNRTMTQMTLSQIGKRPSSDKCLDRQGYSLAAGWALGMICLGIGDKRQSFRDLQLQQRLIRFIQGGKRMDAPQSMISTNFVNQNKCSSIKQGPNVNLHITAPAALLSVALMYLKSNSRDIADKITIPNSFNTIQECNPNHILLKTLTKNLIMWDQIQNTKQFALNQIPQLIKFIYQNPLSKVYQRYYLVYNVSQIDYQTISTIYASVLTGAILGMAFKYAGTGNKTAMQTIKWHIQQLKNIKIIKSEFANDPLNKNSIDQYQLFSLLSTSIIALSIVMAGTCDIQSLKIIRIIRKKFFDSKSFHYGFSMAVNLSIGFLFLGYGNYTFNRQNMSIAALLIAVYPQYPNSPTDNKWHLQALRHFYVLAMQQKIFHAVDVDSNKVVNVNAQMDFLIDDRVVTDSLHTPILLQQSKKLLRVKIKDEDYFDTDFTFDPKKSDPKAIYIKKKRFQQIDKSLLNPENPLYTEIAAKNVYKSLHLQNRFTALIEKKSSKNALSYLLPNSSKLKRISQEVQKRSKTTSNKNQYFKLLKQDKLQLIQLYENLKINSLNLKQSESLLINNLALLNQFKRHVEYDDMFNENILKIINEYEASLLKNTFFQNYILAEVGKKEIKKGNKEEYQSLRMLNVPSWRSLMLIQQAIKNLKQRGQNSQTIQMILFLSFPQCQHKIILRIMQILSK